MPRAVPAPAPRESSPVVLRDKLSTVVLGLSALSAVLLFIGSFAYGQVSHSLDFLSTDARMKIGFAISALFLISVMISFVAAGLCIKGTYLAEEDDGPPA